MQAPDSRVRVYNNGEFIGIGVIQENKLRPVRTI
ncbi:MAG: tRNA pseudouridine(55) synthase TruB [Alphaproteobacteria bacterium]